MTGRLIGLLGRKRSGKNATAARLTAEHGYTELAFADPLRAMARAVDPVVGFIDAPWTDRAGGVIPVRYSEALDNLGYEAAKEAYPEFRRFLQRLGTEGVRDTLGLRYGLREDLGDDVWIHLTEQRIWDHLAAGRSVVATDVRFPNEAALIERLGGTTVRVVRPGFADDGDPHPSETSLDDYVAHRRIVNDGTLDDLAAEVDELVASL